MSLPDRLRIVVSMAALPEAAAALLARHDVVLADPAIGAKSVLPAVVARHDPHAMLVRFGRIDAALIDSAPSLSIIAKYGSGTDSMDLAHARARGIAVSSTPGANAPAVAEHAMALMLAAAKGIPLQNAKMHAGAWAKIGHESLQLAGRTLGVIGFGAIGQRVARLGRAFGMKIIVYVQAPRALPRYVRAVALRELWRSADFISLHCALTSQTAGIVNATSLARCRRGVVVVNTGRGGLVDDAALVAALQSGQVGAAGLDTFTTEPLGEDNPYRGLPNVVMTPHLGAATREAFETTAVLAARNLLADVSRLR